jgi:single-stranded-DNA-specific exonuclease
MDVVVTDHHQPKERLPKALAVVNPLLGDYPFRRLCGAGVAFKLVQALAGTQAALEFVDFAALGTIADIVPLLDENRAIASLGLARLNENMRVGVGALCRVAGLRTKTLNSGHIGFLIGPRINAGGRIDRSTKSVELL